jgi:flagellar motor switch protein FliG
MAQALARITPAKMAAPREAAPAAALQIVPRQLSPREKAAVVVRFLVAEGAAPPLSALPEHMQAALTEQIGLMRLVDRATLAAVVEEFVQELEAVGLSFPGGIEGALSLMDGHISQTAAGRLRRLAGASTRADPWDRIAGLPPDRLAQLLDREGIEVVAVTLSKLPVGKAADVLALMPGERARRAAYAMSQTAGIHPETVRRIGAALISEIESTPPRAFDAGPVERVGAILNLARHETRETVLAGLDAEDSGFAAEVRKALFTFAHIPARLAPRDVPRAVRMIEGPLLVTALIAAEQNPGTQEVAAFLLANLSSRMAQGLRDEMAERGPVKPREGEAAMAAVVAAIRQLEAAGEIVLQSPED